MTTVRHAFESEKSDGGDDTLVRPSNWNADHVIEGALAAGFIGAKARWESGTLSALGSYVPVDLNGAEEFDTDGFHSSVTNPSRMTIPAGLGGKYLVLGSFYGANVQHYTSVRTNGSAIRGSYGVSGDDGISATSHVLDLVAGDYVELVVNANTTNTINEATLTVIKLDAGRVGSGVGAILRHSTTQSIANNTFTALNMDTEEEDTDGFHSLVSDTSRVTIPAGLGGMYFASSGTSFTASSGGIQRQIYLRKNGTAYTYANILDAAEATTHAPVVTALFKLVPGDYIEAVVYQDSGGNLNAGANSASYLHLAKIDSLAANPGQELGYAEGTAGSPMSVTATTAATAQTVVTAPSVTFDGTPVMIEFFAPVISPANTPANSEMYLQLWDNTAGTRIGYIGYISTPAANRDYKSITVRRRMTPASGARVYSIRAHVNTGTGQVYSGAGGQDTYMPAYIRITRV